MKTIVQFEETKTVTLRHMQCGECSIHFAMDQGKYDRCKESGEGWYCPNGHSRMFTRSRVQELESKLEEQKIETQKMTDRFLEEVHTRNKLTQQLKRVHRGVCPCCNRTFQNLKRHMEQKHPTEAKKVSPSIHSKISNKRG